MIYRIFEIADDGTRTVAGWGDHASLASAKATISRWGRIRGWKLDTQFGAVDALIEPGEGLPPTFLAIEPVNDTQEYITQ